MRVLVLAICCLVVAPFAAAAPSRTPDVSVVIDGVGSAHGMGLAMDGVQGQARAGWKYRDILALFYPGTKTGKAKGTVRVGLAEGAEHTVELPSGGEVGDSPTGRHGPGFPLHVPPGGRVVVTSDYAVRVPGLVGAAQTEVVPVPTPGPSGEPPIATPAPASPVPDAPATAPKLRSSRPIWITPSGSPALMKVAATGRRYRGRMELRTGVAGTLWAVNHVDMETYVRGIAEEKGQGWPVEGLKVLAVAARTLAAATTQWYTKHHANGFDICPTGQCQVYLGYDGEEPAMTKATDGTAGEILQYDARPILAMYHGNGGGRTDSYRLMYGNGVSDPYPYLRSVSYPFANPERWTRTLTSGEVAGAAGVAGRLESVEVIERGDSPRVRRLRVRASKGTAEMTGLGFQNALSLRSAWFDVRIGAAATPTSDVVVTEQAQVGFGLERTFGGPPSLASSRSDPEPARRPDVLAMAMLGIAAALIATTRPHFRRTRPEPPETPGC